ncbi:MAG: HAD-IB family hydrolase [Gammaproteobacteria bacterium]|nr:HAD-IB family hydrolase [Gammaproteobacteria bacterium]
MKQLAIFDLDETLISIDSDHAWGQFIVDRQLVDAHDYRKRNDAFYQQYKAGELDADAYYRFASEVLTCHSYEMLVQIRQEFVESIIAPHILPAAMALIDYHRQQDHHLVVVTATLEFITAPIVSLLGIGDLIAPVPEVSDGQYTGNISGVPSFREGKLIRIRDWLGEQARLLESAWFYSDSFNDLPLLEAVGYPVAVDPDSQLETVANARGWRIISLR